MIKIRDQNLSFFPITKVNYPFSDPLNVQNSNLCQTNIQNIKSVQKYGTTKYKNAQKKKKPQKQITNVIHKNRFLIISMVGRAEVKKGCHFFLITIMKWE